MRALIEKNTNDWEAAFPAIDERLYAAADAWKNAPYYEFLSAGPEFASAGQDLRGRRHLLPL